MNRDSNKARPNDPVSSEDDARETTWSRLEPFLDQLLNEPDERRRDLAIALSSGDEELRAELLRFLDSIEASESFLTGDVGEAWPDLVADLDVDPGAVSDHSPASGAPPKARRNPAPERRGQQLGVYQLEGLIGRGGMGEVYLAHRVDGAFQRRVAIKIARDQQGAATSLERFQAEQHILADLDHPNIAGLLDAGLTPDGLPYAVMEYVEGQSLDTYARGHTLEEKLRLFLAVCAAVDHAHRRLVIHRDLKPSNILVDQSGRVKLLDFGIAKLLDPVADAAQDAGTLYLTPEYAAPEQFLRGRLSVATDVFALGAILFELLTGTSLRRFEGSSPPVWMKKILNESAPRPSDFVDEPRVARRLRGDLDAIVERALEADPEARYPSARDLAEDLRRHLEARPIRARGASRLYRAGRILKRHWLGISFGSLIAVLLLASTATAIRESRLAEKERGNALQAAMSAEQVSTFLIDLFDSWNPYDFQRGEVSARDLLDLGAERAQIQAYGAPEARLELLTALAEVYARLGLVEQSYTMLENLPPVEELAQASQRSGWHDIGDLSPGVTFRLLQLHAQLHHQVGHYDQAEPLYGQALDLLAQQPENEARSGNSAALRCILLGDRGGLRYQTGQYEAASVDFKNALEIARSMELGECEAGSLAGLASVIHGGRRFDEDLLRQAIAIYRQPDVDDPQSFQATLNNLAIVLLEQGAWAEAATKLEELVSFDRAFLKGEHPLLASRLVNLARLRIDQGFFDTALDLLEETDRILEAINAAPSSRERIALGMSQGRALAELGDRRALPVLLETEKHFLEAMGTDHVWVPAIQMRIAEAMLRLGEVDSALEYSQAALAGLAEGHPRRSDAELVRGAALAALGRCPEALPPLKTGMEALAAKLPAEAWRLAWARVEVEACRREVGDGGVLTPAIAEILESTRGPDDALARRAWELVP